MKRLAVHLYGHARTFEETHENFFRNIVAINALDYDEIDLFIHTWDKLQEYNTDIWHKNNHFYPTFNNQPLTKEHQQRIQELYKPKGFKVESLERGEHGMLRSIKEAWILRSEYEKAHHFCYDAYLYTRPDMMFFTPLRILDYLEYWKGNSKFDSKLLFSGHSSFSRMPIADPRMLTEAELVYFTKFPDYVVHDDLGEFVNIAIDYWLHRDFWIWRETYLDEAKEPMVHFIQKSVIKNQSMQDLSPKPKESLEHELLTLPCHKSDQFFSYKKSAQERVRNHLAYKLGEAMVINSKSLWGYCKMPFVLSYLKEQHKKQQANIESACVAPPPIDSLKDYQEALREQSGLTYKLGLALMEAQRNWHRGGYLKLWFVCKKLKKRYKNKEPNAYSRFKNKFLHKP